MHTRIHVYTRTCRMNLSWTTLLHAKRQQKVVGGREGDEEEEEGGVGRGGGGGGKGKWGIKK